MATSRPEPAGSGMHDGNPSWQDMLTQERAARLLEEITAYEVVSMNHPHIVVGVSVRSGAVEFIGPYPDGVAATLAAERLAGGTGADLTYTPAALIPPVDDANRLASEDEIP